MPEADNSGRNLSQIVGVEMQCCSGQVGKLEANSDWAEENEIRGYLVKVGWLIRAVPKN